MYRVTDLATPGTVYAVALRGTARMPDCVRYPQGSVVRGLQYDPADIPQGTELYISNCASCHGGPAADNGDDAPNLGHVPPVALNILNRFVFQRSRFRINPAIRISTDQLPLISPALPS